MSLVKPKWNPPKKQWLDTVKTMLKIHDSLFQEEKFKISLHKCFQQTSLIPFKIEADGSKRWVVYNVRNSRAGAGYDDENMIINNIKEAGKSSNSGVGERLYIYICIHIYIYIYIIGFGLVDLDTENIMTRSSRGKRVNNEGEDVEIINDDPDLILGG